MSGLILLFLIGLSFLISSPLKAIVEKEAGEEFTDFDFYKNPAFFRFLEEKGIRLINCKRITDFDELSIDKVGDYSIQFLVNGKNLNSILKIKDSKKPELSAKDVVIPAGETVTIEDFVLSVSDATKVTIKEKGLSKYMVHKKSGTYLIKLTAIDDGGNKVSHETHLFALPLKKEVKVELGDSKIEAKVFLKPKKKKTFEIDFKEGFNIEPLLREEGKYTVPVTVILDGKKRNLELKLLVKDTKPPIFLGLKDKTIGIGEEISYRKNVEVKDNQPEEIDFKVDASKVNVKKEGVYPVIFTAKDKAGNKVEKKMRVHVISSKKRHYKEVRAYVEETLKNLIHEDMTDIEKLRKIFDFCHQISYSGTSNKEDIIEAAYEGFKTRTGDCFTYYSVARLLLTEAGFSEEMVKREGGKGRHYWNLVKFKEEWYHFDSCPISASEGFIPFMVSDEDLLNFSKKYGARFPEREGYYHFKNELYPERADSSLRKK